MSSKESRWSSTRRTLIAGSCGGIASTLVVHPLDTLRTRLQVAKPGTYAGALDCARQAIKNEGLFSLYRGLAWPIAAQGLYKCVMFGVYGLAIDQLKDGHNKRPELWQLALAGGAAGGTNALVLTPIELVRNRLQIATGSSRAGGLAVLREALAQGNPQGNPPGNRASLARSPALPSALPSVTRTARTLWRGLPATLCRDIPGVSAYYLCFEAANRHANRRHRQRAEEEEAAKIASERARGRASPGGESNGRVQVSSGGSGGSSSTGLRTVELAAAGALGGCGYWVVALPFDAAKSVMQTSASPQPLRSTLRTLFKEGGLPRLYVGFGSALLRGIPGAAVVFATYGTVLAHLEQADARR